MMKQTIENYLQYGCGRCSKYKTPNCKAIVWRKEIRKLRQIVLDCALDETIKWGQPCYVYQQKNVLLISPFKSYLALAFFKGVLLSDSKRLLVAPGKNSQTVRQLRFKNMNEIFEAESQIKTYIKEAVEIEKSGRKVEFKQQIIEMPNELQTCFENDSEFRNAFFSLTPGRQRGYLIYFSQPKKSETRLKRILKSKETIFKGKGLNEGFKKSNNN